MKIKFMVITFLLVIGMVAAVSAGGGNRNVNVPQPKVSLLVLPEGYRITSIFAPSQGQNMAWEQIKRYRTVDLITLVQSPNAKIVAEKYENGKWMKMAKKDLIELFKSGKVKDVPQGKALKFGSFAKTRAQLNRCASVFDPVTHASIPLYAWERMPPQAQEAILKHPVTQKYLKASGCTL